VNTTILAEELAQLNTQIEQVRQKHDALLGELGGVEAEIETFSADRQRFERLRDVCDALGKLGELKADALFWDGVLGAQDVAGHLERARSRVTRFEGEISGILEKQASLKAAITQCLEELSILDDEVQEAYDREERREEEYVIEREISDVPARVVVMPWSKESESEKRYQKSLLYAMAFYIVFGSAIGLWKLPVIERPAVVVVPERLARMLKKEPPRPETVAERHKEDKKVDKNKEKASDKPKEEQPAPSPAEAQVARRKAETTGVLAFKETLKELMEETPAARLGAEARLSNQSPVVAGQARATRSLVSIASSGGVGGSGGISNSGISRNIGGGNGNRIGGVGFTRVESNVAGLGGEGTRPLSSGPGPARTDEEIQIVFDRYKAALYRMYNAELRKDPTLRGKILLRITIEPGGEVSACTVQSSELGSPELVAQVVLRVGKFNFGPKENVPKITILYPIDFLPGG
jgi:outer membrane biosynthesis protein TonB